MMNSPYTIIAAFVAGLLFGSFMNVLIYRLPRDENVVAGRSKCPKCKAMVGWRDNIPIVSYVLLRGKCRHCNFRIPVHYPTVELASGVIAALVVVFMGPTLKALWMYVFFGTLLVITFIDWFHQIIPDPLSVGGVVFGWIGSLVCLDISLPESIVGSLVGGGVILAIALLYKALRKIDGIGGGDVKLMAMIGAFLGWQMVFPVLFIASFLGSIYGIVLMRRKSADARTAVAFGSFLAPSATIVYFAGARLLELYLGR
jgi:leader peptidase (prepilin peptidase)/N-methyltransferase